MRAERLSEDMSIAGSAVNFGRSTLLRLLTRILNHMKTQRLGARAFKKIILAALLLGSVSSAHAGMNVNFGQVGADVVITMSGSWDAWTNAPAFPHSGESRVWYSSDETQVTNVLGDFDVHSRSLTGAVTGGPFAAGVAVLATTREGDNTGLAWVYVPGFFEVILTYAPKDYVNGSAISSSMTYNSTSLADLNISGSAGTWDIVSVGGSENVTWTVSGIPEPSSAAFLLGCGAGLVCLRRQK